MIGFVAGLVTGLILDTAWWSGRLGSKYEKGFLVNIEHFHVAILALIGSIITGVDVLAGVAVALLIAEWSEPLSPDKEKHPFAYGSGHFKQSAMLGGILAAILTLLWATI